MKKMIESQNVIHVAGNTWCLNTVASIPIYFIDDRNVILLDTGYSDDRSRPALMEFLEENELKVSTILGTHTHYDHVGNHNYLKTRYGSEIIMPELEAALGANYQMLSPVYWQYTRRELENGPLSILAVETDRTFENKDGKVVIEDREFGIISLPGHTPGHVGIITPDDVLYVGDAILSEEVLRTSRVLTSHDWEIDLESKERLKKEKHLAYILAHRGVYDEIDALIEANIKDKDSRTEALKKAFSERESWTIETAQSHLWKTWGMKTKSEFNQRIFSRNVYYAIKYLAQIGFMESYIVDGVVHYRASR